MYVFIDDERCPEDVTWLRLPDASWTIVRDALQFNVLLAMSDESIEFISFDHDLGDTTKGTGMDCAKLLVDHCINENIPLPDYSVHSMNPVGRLNITSYLENYRRFSQQS